MKGIGCGRDHVHRKSGPLLSVSNLSVSLGRRPVLEDMSMDVRRGEMVGLIGPNGGGKTTLLRTILGFIRPDRGQIRTHMRGQPGYLPQELRVPRNFPVLTFDLVRLGVLRGTFTERPVASTEDCKVRDALKTVGLDVSLWQVPAGALSGGQKKLALLAMLLAGGSELFLLDEPAAALDHNAHSRIVGALRSICDDLRAGVLMATHDAGLISHLDRVVHVGGDTRR